MWRKAKVNFWLAPILCQSKPKSNLSNFNFNGGGQECPSPHLTPRMLVDGHGAAAAGAFHQENHRDKGRDGDSQQPEIVNIRQHRSLAENIRLHQGVGPVHGFGGGKAAGYQSLRGALNHRPHRRIGGR